MKIKKMFTIWLATVLFMNACSIFSREPVFSSTDCSVGSVLSNLRNTAAFDELMSEYSVNLQAVPGTKYLDFWFVDPNLINTPGSTSDENNWLALRDAAFVSISVVSLDPCIPIVFDAINPVVVDTGYNGWFSGSIDVSKIPLTSDPSDQEIIDTMFAFEIVYQRSSLPEAIDAPPSGSCTWTEAKEKMYSHFDEARLNVDFYFVGDEVSRKVTVQWDGEARNTEDIGEIYASISNVAQEIHCLYPRPDYLYIMVVNENGILGLMARLPYEGIQSMDLNQLEILFPTQ